MIQVTRDHRPYRDECDYCKFTATYTIKGVPIGFQDACDEHAKLAVLMKHVARETPAEPS